MSAYVVSNEELLRELSFLIQAEEEDVLTGTILVWPATSIPAGYLECNGQLVLRVDYPDLFAFIGTAFGSSGPDDFALPDLQARTIFGPSPGGLPTGRPVALAGGEVGGEQFHLLLAAESGIPGNPFSLASTDGDADVPSVNTGNLMLGSGGNSLGATSVTSVSAADAPNSHNTMCPFMALPWIMKT